MITWAIRRSVNMSIKHCGRCGSEGGFQGSALITGQGVNARVTSGVLSAGFDVIYLDSNDDLAFELMLLRWRY